MNWIWKYLKREARSPEYLKCIDLKITWRNDFHEYEQILDATRFSATIKLKL